MKLAYFPNQTALQSDEVWKPFLEGCKKIGLTPAENARTADAALIWSVLWAGRMKNNKFIFDSYKKEGKPVFIIEVGSLKRGKTWKIALNNITSAGIYGNDCDLDIDRPKKLGLSLHNINNNRSSSILIACQRPESQQWGMMPEINSWLSQTIKDCRQYTKRPIIIRPHPRFRVSPVEGKDISIEFPTKIPNTYDEFNINYNHHCVINHNSAPAVQSAIYGTPVICHPTSLAYPMSSSMELIEQPVLPERDEWFLKICHTEWTVDEIAEGIPQKRLLKYLT